MEAQTGTTTKVNFPGSFGKDLEAEGQDAGGARRNEQRFFARILRSFTSWRPDQLETAESASPFLRGSW